MESKGRTLKILLPLLDHLHSPNLVNFDLSFLTTHLMYPVLQKSSLATILPHSRPHTSVRYSVSVFNPYTYRNVNC